MSIEKPDMVHDSLLAGRPVVFSQSAPSDERTVAAGSLTEALRSGVTVSLEHARVVGRLDLRNSQIRGDVSLRSCEVQEFADLSYAVFERTLRFHECRFQNGVCFDSARLRSDVWLDDSTFAAPPGESQKDRTTLFNDADFSAVLSAQNVKFTGGVTTSFERARFGSLVMLTSARFEGTVNLAHVRVSGDLLLQRATFLRPCTLDRAIVVGSISLSESRFSRRAHLSLLEAEVGRGIVLSDTVVLGYMTAIRARFGSIDASRAVFAHGIVLDDAAIAGSATLPRSRFGRRYFADLRRLSVGGQLDLSDALFKGPLRVDDAIVKQTLHAEQSRFMRSATFDGLEAGAVNLVGARFESRAPQDAPSFSRVTILGAFTASGSRFQRGVILTKSRIGELTIEHARSYGTIDLGWTTVSGILSLSSTRVRSADTAVNLQSTTVGKIAWFDDARFAGNVFAIGLHIDKQLSWNNVITLGDADFYELAVERGAFLQSSTFRGALTLNRAHVPADAYLSGTVCRGTAAFNSASIATLHLGKSEAPHDRPAVFNGGISLQHARLGYINFREVAVHNDVEVLRRSRSAKRDSDVLGKAHFDHCEVSGVANFTDAKFHVPTTFYGATFVGEALFQRVDFTDPEVTSFSTTTFKARAVFYRVHFAAGADFGYARFENAALFRARFGGKATFDMCRFLSAAEFSEPATIRWDPHESIWADPTQPLPGSSFADCSFIQARFSGDARFDSVKFTSALDLREATFVTLYLPSDDNPRTESELLPLKIGLAGCRYEHIVLRHPQNLLLRDGKALRLIEGYDRQPFAQLENTLRRAGDDRAADRVYLSGRRAEGRQMPPISRLVDWVYGELVNYGVRPWRLAAVAVLFVFFGAWFFSHPGSTQLKDKDLRAGTAYPITWEEALNLGLAHFLPVSLPIRDHLVPTSHVVTVRVPIPAYGPAVIIRVRPTTVATLLQLAGWILVPIGVAAMTGVLMRKTK